MKISHNWLKQYIDTALSPEKMAELLTGCGLEVESIEEFHQVKGGLKGVVVGEVLSCEKHPNSDHLTLTRVSVGKDGPLDIVCGAPNVAAGQKVAVALTGTTLYFNDKELTLQKTKIRGAVSEGMICAQDELGLGSDHSGIMVLDRGALPGTPAADYFGIETDWVYTIGLTPNRADAASHFGVARDVAAVLNSFGKDVEDDKTRISCSFPDVNAFAQDNDELNIGISVVDPDACPRYTGVTLTGLKVAESPSWLKNRLLAVGLRPINNIVDITNFVLMETGHPLHAFDAAKISGRQVIVKKYPEGTPFVTLDEIERKLSANDLMICSTTEPMCIGGVFGGTGSGVTCETTSVFLESACFDPVHIRRTAKYHGLSTDASFRFERGADPNMTVYALKRAALLMKELAGGKISSPVVDVYPNPRGPAQVGLYWNRLDLLAGKKLNRKIVTGLLADLGMNPSVMAGNDGLELAVPTNKVDVTREVDVIEEILRIYGYNNIEILPEIRSSLSYTSKPDPDKMRNVVSDYLSSRGFNEIMNNSLSRSGYYINSKDYPETSCVRILNPISRDLDVMRQTLLFGAMESILYNANRKMPDLKLYEFGSVYRISHEPGEPVNGYHEESHLSIAITGRILPENWNSESSEADWFELKAYLEAIFRRLGIGNASLSSSGRPEYVPYEGDSLFAGQALKINGKTIGTAGRISPALLKLFDLKQEVFYAELNWSEILRLIPSSDARYAELPKFPEVRRDLALLIDRAVSFEEIEKTAFQTERKILRKVGLFDVYEGEKIGEGKQSYALSFILRDDEKTLTDKDIEKCMNRLVQAFERNFGAKVR
jgi:phenylalanyl-tRNA synthetase beta chain